MGSSHDAEDLIQDLFVELYPKTDLMNTIESLKPWLMRCLYHRFIDTYRKTKRQPLHVDIDDDTTELGLQSVDVAESAVVQSEIIALLDNLSAPQRAIVSLHDIEGYKLQEIATMLDQPLSTVKSHLRRARLLLKTSPQLQPFAPQ